MRFLSPAYEVITALGDGLLMGLEALARVGTMDRREFVQALWDAGSSLVFPVLLVSFFGGVLLALQTEPIVAATGAASVFGWAVGYTYLREVGPLLAGLVFLGRTALDWAGTLAYLNTAHTPRSLAFAGVDPVSYFVAPRVWAAVTSLPLLLALGNVAALAGAVTYGEFAAGISRAGFMDSLLGGLHTGDLFMGVVKAALFGMGLTVAAAVAGLRASGGEEGVARAVRSAAFAGLLSMVSLDFIVTRWWA